MSLTYYDIICPFHHFLRLLRSTTQTLDKILAGLSTVPLSQACSDSLLTVCFLGGVLASAQPHPFGVVSSYLLPHPHVAE